MGEAASLRESTAITARESRVDWSEEKGLVGRSNIVAPGLPHRSREEWNIFTITLPRRLKMLAIPF